MPLLTKNIFANSNIAGLTVTSIVHDGTLPNGVALSINPSLNGEVTFDVPAGLASFSCAFTAQFQSADGCACSPGTITATVNPPPANTELTCEQFNADCPASQVVPILCGALEPTYQFQRGSSEWIRESQIAASTQFSVADGFTDPNHQGSHFHNTPSGSGGGSGSPFVNAFDGMEVGGFFGDELIRGFAEFDVSSLVGGETVTLRVRIADVLSISFPSPGGLFTQAAYAGPINVYAYPGNLAPDITDYDVPVVFVGSFTVPNGVVEGDYFTLQIPNSAITSGILGLQFRIAPESLEERDAITFDDATLRITSAGCPPKDDLIAVLDALSLVGQNVKYKPGCKLEFSASAAGLAGTITFDASTATLSATVDISNSNGDTVLSFPMTYQGSCTPPWEVDNVEYNFVLGTPTIGVDCVDMDEPGPTLILNPFGAPGC